VREVATRDAVLGAACLLEAPQLQLGEDAIEEIARRVWGECASWRRHQHPRVGARLIWALLGRSSHADKLLLEFLTHGSNGHRRPMGEGEMEVFLLANRPPIPISARFGWVLRQLERSGRHISWVPLWSIAGLLLVEGGAARPEDHVAALVRLLGEQHWGDVDRGTLGERAERILRILARGETQEAVRQALEAANSSTEEGGDSDPTAYASAKLLLSLGLTVSIVETSDALVQRGLKPSYLHDEVCRDLHALLDNDRYRETILSALRRGVTSDNEHVRTGSVRVLKEAGIVEPPLALLSTDDEEKVTGSDSLRLLLADPSKKVSALAALAEALWDEQEEVAWRATQALLEENCGRTPGVIHALVRVGLGSESLRATASEHLQRLREDTRLDLTVRGALLDGLRSESEAVATASALLLTDFGEARGEARVLRITKAILRDPKQTAQALPRLRHLLEQQAAGAVVKAIGEYIGGKDVNQEIASLCAQLMVETGRLDTAHLPRALVLCGLVDEARHDRIITYIKRMLEDPKLVTDTRKSLSEGLQSEDESTAWGSARCLWEVGSRTDSHLASAIIRGGLNNASRRATARKWLLELLAQPRTAVKTIPALEEAVSTLVYRATDESADLAWQVSECLLAAQIFDVDHFARGVVTGLRERERHGQIVLLVQQLLRKNMAIGEVLEEELWSAVRQKADYSSRFTGLGAARVLIEANFRSVPAVMAGDDYETEERAVVLIRTLVANPSEDFASAALRRLVESPESSARARKALIRLLKDDDTDIAYAAARSLFALGDTSHRNLPSALVQED
jgi:hypothetical protein